jgi:hypothetical protein
MSSTDWAMILGIGALGAIATGVKLIADKLDRIIRLLERERH